jgi:hypothetical protein
MRVFEFVFGDILCIHFPMRPKPNIVTRAILKETVFMRDFSVCSIINRVVGEDAKQRQPSQSSFSEPEQPQRVHPVHGIIQTVPIPIRIAARIAQGVGGGPATGEGIIIAPPEADETEIPVVQAASKAPRDAQGRIAGLDDPAEWIVQGFLYRDLCASALCVLILGSALDLRL